MNFTREPTIETIITPKEGSKLLIRNSKRESREDYLVDAIEVISFGHSIFYRSLERPKSFVVPVTDYEVVEVKETRLALKSASIERSIKIGGGRVAPRVAEVEKPQEEEAAESRPPEKKKERRRTRRRRPSDEKEVTEERAIPTDAKPEEKKRMTRLLPPPPTLISETIGRYREAIHPEAAPLPNLAHAEKKDEPKIKVPKMKDNDDEPPPSEKKSFDEPKVEEKSDSDKASFWGLFS